MGSAAVLGTGLIGASLGMALRQVGWVVAGWDPDPSALEVATQRGAVDHPRQALDWAVSGAELVVLAGPLSATLETLRGLRTAALVTDVAGVKVPVVESKPPDLRLVAGHPMAGREQAGPAAATPALFRGAAWIVCPDGADPEDVAIVESMVEAVGAIPYAMPASEHDRVVAAISHLPQVIAVSLVNLAAGDPGAMQLVAGSFRDLTRVAASEPGWWPELLAANEANVSRAITGMIEELEEARAEIRADPASLAARIRSARARRRGMAPPEIRVGVVLQDRPGEIAAVGRALEQCAVDIRDLQLRHALHGGGGVLTLSVRPVEADALRESLEKEGFTLE
ncbi:MAG: prephenate dehydrogenase/arogenate dehydrogenase family protein [bacterium]|nr:prephenate dehydrogenase/arogenate dehydrogenase family protein [bacterium]MDE0289658.1 prephenate dehydrogenase/arogenate dehydrogenase family protein [bacterium]